jgi:hypothetical protein
MPRLILKIDDAVAAMLDAQVEALSKSQAAREFGVVVNRQVAARVALMRGLSVMGSVGGVGSTDSVGSAQDASEADSPDTPVESIDVDEHGRVQPPEGWAPFKPSEKIPPEQSDVHEYYLKHGWLRWYGNTGNEAISFYWCDNQAHQSLDPWTGADAKGKTVVVQTTPWGPGHIIPHGWSGV